MNILTILSVTFISFYSVFSTTSEGSSEKKYFKLAFVGVTPEPIKVIPLANHPKGPSLPGESNTDNRSGEKPPSTSDSCLQEEIGFILIVYFDELREKLLDIFYIKDGGKIVSLHGFTVYLIRVRWSSLSSFNKTRFEEVLIWYHYEKPGTSIGKECSPNYLALDPLINAIKSSSKIFKIDTLEAQRGHIQELLPRKNVSSSGYGRKVAYQCGRPTTSCWTVGGFILETYSMGERGKAKYIDFLDGYSVVKGSLKSTDHSNTEQGIKLSLNFTKSANVLGFSCSPVEQMETGLSFAGFYPRRYPMEIPFSALLNIAVKNSDRDSEIMKDINFILETVEETVEETATNPEPKKTR